MALLPAPANCTPTGTCALGTNWATSTALPYTAPNCAFHDAPGCVTDSILDTPSFVSGRSQRHFPGYSGHSYDLESGMDGAVLEISINGGPFVDFVAAGGGSLGYNGTISSGSLSPIAGRAAWTGNSGGYVYTSWPRCLSRRQQNVRLRFRLATDCSGAGTGWQHRHYFRRGTTSAARARHRRRRPPVVTHFEVIAPSMVATFQPFNFTVRAAGSI